MHQALLLFLLQLNVREVDERDWLCRVCCDVKVEEEPARQDPDSEDGVELVTVYVTVHNAEHDTVLPGLKVKLMRYNW